MRYRWLICLLFAGTGATAQVKLTPDILLRMGRVHGLGLTRDKKALVFSVARVNLKENTFDRKYYSLPVEGGTPVAIGKPDSLLPDSKLSPDGRHLLHADTVKLIKTSAADFYPGLNRANAQEYDYVNTRFWDRWDDGKFYHLSVSSTDSSQASHKTDLLAGQPFYCPRKIYNGATNGGEDYCWNPDNRHVAYTCKKMYGTAGSLSTNWDIYEYDLVSGTTRDLTEKNKSYDICPVYNRYGQLAWIQNITPGDIGGKYDVVVSSGPDFWNLTAGRDDISVMSYAWNDDGKNIFFVAPTDATLQLFAVSVPSRTGDKPVVRQVTRGDFDVATIVGQAGSKLVVSREDMNHAAEMYTVDINSGAMTQLTHVNDSISRMIYSVKTKKRIVETTDHQKMPAWIVYPPDFDSTKKYPSLLYCEGGPSVAVSQFYHFRWNFQLMATEGYIINVTYRRGMPGLGTAWNAAVHDDWGGQAIDDLLRATDDLSKESYIDPNRRGCMGPSFGGYSVFALEGRHEGRFHSFVAHAGIFDFRSFFGESDIPFYQIVERGGNYWDTTNNVAQRSFRQSPSNLIAQWNTPILILQGGKDYRVPADQGLQAFTAAQLKGIKSRFIYFPEESHSSASPQNALFWHYEFFRWLRETL